MDDTKLPNRAREPVDPTARMASDRAPEPSDGATGAGAGAANDTGRPPLRVLGLSAAASARTERAALAFEQRLRRVCRHLRRWPSQGIECFRLYDRDVQEVPMAVDRYRDCLVVSEYDLPRYLGDSDPEPWRAAMRSVLSRVTGTSPADIFVRRRTAGKHLYRRLGHQQRELIVSEGGLRFRVNLSDYLDTGLYLDHRITRSIVRAEALDKRVLNLFCYTGAFTVYAAAGGAHSTVSVDLSKHYLAWAASNLELNQLAGPRHRWVRAGVVEFVEALRPLEQFDLIVVDAPTFSNSKGLERDFDVRRGHGPLIERLARQVAPGGSIYFSTHSRKFKLEEAALAGFTVRDITRQTIPPDFRDKKIHRAWRITC